MQEFIIPPGCSIRLLTEELAPLESVQVVIEKNSSFSLGAEGFFVSLFKYMFEKGRIDSIKIYLAKHEVEKHGITPKAVLHSPYFISICIHEVNILDRYNHEVTDGVLNAIDNSFNADEGFFEGSQSYCLFALDPYFEHPKALLSNQPEPSEEDFKALLKDKIEDRLIGKTQEATTSLGKITESINLYAFLKEVWENTAHHARIPDQSLRYIQISRLMFSNVSAIDKAEYAEGVANYLKTRLQKDNKRRFLVFEIVDSGPGIFVTLRKKGDQRTRAEIVRSSFTKDATSKKERSTIKRGLGLPTAIKCTKELDGLLIMTTSGTWCSNYRQKNDDYVGNLEVFDLGLNIDDLSTSVTLIIPV